MSYPAAVVNQPTEPSPAPGAAPGPGPGLRDRKRREAMLRIQAVALDLFEHQGFDAVTVEEIAAGALVSPSSVYRYFGTKEEIVLWDEYDLGLEALLGSALAEQVPLEGVRRILFATLDDLTAEAETVLRRRATLMTTTPALEQAAAARAYGMAETVGRLLATQLGRPEQDLDVQVFAHALTGGLLGMMHHWQGSGFAAPLSTVAERVFVIFEEGLDIITPDS